MIKNRLTLKELIFTALCAVMGMVAKPLFSPLFNFLTDFIRIPGGSVTAGVSILFLVFAAGMIQKPGTALLAGRLQSVVSLTTGISANAGILVLITYSLPGLAIDAVMLHLGKNLPMKERMMLAGAAGVLTGAASTNLLFFHMSVVPFILFYLFGILSGALGGYFAYVVLERMPKQYRR